MSAKKRVVLDTNVLISAFITHDSSSPPAKLYEALKDQRYILITSRLILREVKDVLGRKKIAIKYHLPPQRRAKIMQLLRALSVVTSGSLKVKVVDADPADDKFFSCAIEGGADYIVSGDRHVLGVREYSGIQVIPPRRFVEILRF
jgi:putative PIN family toxin of toxin-antitoxin system